MGHRATAIVLVVGVIIYTLLFTALSIVRHEAFNTAIFDLGIMTQVTWNRVHGRWLEMSIDRATETELTGRYLADPVLGFLNPSDIQALNASTV